MDEKKKQIFRELGFSAQIDRIEKGLCSRCEKKIDPDTEFSDNESRREFERSGYCQKCQNIVFG